MRNGKSVVRILPIAISNTEVLSEANDLARRDGQCSMVYSKNGCDVRIRATFFQGAASRDPHFPKLSPGYHSGPIFSLANVLYLRRSKPQFDHMSVSAANVLRSFAPLTILASRFSNFCGTVRIFPAFGHVE